MDKTEHDAFAHLFRDMFEHKKREARFLFILLVISLCMNVIEVTAFLYFQSQWDYKTTTTTTTTQSVDGQDNDIVNGDQYNDESQNRSQ